MADTTASDTIVTDTSNGVGVITLNKPSALNALDIDMIRAIRSALVGWADDDSVDAVVVRSNSPRAFCAGGDIRQIRTQVLAGDLDGAHAFFREEYDLNEYIAQFPKPYIALIDGAAMGGGLGISIHGDVRVVSEKALLAMPETAIGFFPDIGASYFLPRLNIDSHGLMTVGKYLGMTGARLTGADAVACGLATHFVPHEQFAELTEALLANQESAVSVVEKYATPTPESSLATRVDDIEECFSAPTVTEVADRLRAGKSDWHSETAAALSVVSPRSVWITARLVERGAVSSLRECLDRELALTTHVIQHPDFAEGIRAVLVDKDRKPSWENSTLSEVTPGDIDRVLL
ncbi:enoyl-CoA hydratase/isomerase family protein [Hoyosella rhizosphaerae]|uniref:3-hydroxyisobutyryl-CoA hydrolase n=1 Tax=Hoyosella rhizosphaerae TaxID=1755582 RepID=A0A916UDK4_9ACTN|nr:enoyl-CoA hydratase/isomerase family protein [Hoyosella rhizosphaerae]MBN4925732.1 enoyl-CoA hydratase/isomerase family protein [Hoyosella rhizosphaerae]GGC68375.1 enoyl-CoA hydratase [Hoyosella rhizosphaerae]